MWQNLTIQHLIVSRQALEDPVASVRDAFAETLGSLLALGMNPEAQVSIYILVFSGFSTIPASFIISPLKSY